MTITCELFGVVRHWAGRDAIDVEAETLGQAVRLVASEIPQLVPRCIEEGRLQPGFLANINGERFTSDAQASLSPGDRVLILSSDVGG